MSTLSSTLQQSDSTSVASPGQRWSLATRLAFRFWAVYLFLLIFPFPYNYDGGWPQGLIGFGSGLVHWFGVHILHVAAAHLNFADFYGLVRSLLFVVLAAMATCIWSIADRRRLNYSKLHEWFRVYVPVALGATMLWYAIVKFYHGQFRPAGFARLMLPVGQYTPMELLWTFMGYSYPYLVFTGIVEVIGGILLFIRRSTTIGAIVCCAALTQVFILDVSYGVQLKVVAANLLVMALFLLAPDLPWLAKALILNQPVQPRKPSPFFQRKWLNTALAVILIICGLGWSAHLCIAEHNRRQTEQRSPLYGVWAVETFTVNGQEGSAPPTERWTHVMVDDFNASVIFTNFAIQIADGSQQHFLMHYDPSAMQFGLSTRATILKCYDQTDGDNWNSKGGVLLNALKCPVDLQVTLERPQPGILRLSGQWNGQPVQANLRKLDSPFRLNRPFTWYGLGPRE